MAEKLIGRGQYTLVKLHDGKHMQLHLSCNLPSIQYFSRLTHSFSPDYMLTPLIISPELYFSGSNDNQIAYISKPVWTINNVNPIEFAGVISAFNPYTLTINKNMIDATQMDIEFNCTVTDPDTLLDVNIVAKICFTKQEIENLTPTMILETPNGNFFKNEIHNSLTAVCKLMQGPEEVSYRTKRTWYYMQDNQYTKIEDNLFVYGQGTNTLTVLADFIREQASFKCEIIYNNSIYTEFVTFFKQSDPYILKVESRNGDKMKNGEGIVYCEAHMYRSDIMIPDVEAERMFVFQWKKYNRLSGKQDVNWRNPSTRVIELTKSDINTLSTFMCEVKQQNKTFTYRLPLKFM